MGTDERRWRKRKRRERTRKERERGREKERERERERGRERERERERAPGRRRRARAPGARRAFRRRRARGCSPAPPCCTPGSAPPRLPRTPRAPRSAHRRGEGELGVSISRAGDGGAANLPLRGRRRRLVRRGPSPVALGRPPLAPCADLAAHGAGRAAGSLRLCGHAGTVEWCAGEQGPGAAFVGQRHVGERNGGALHDRAGSGALQQSHQEACSAKRLDSAQDNNRGASVSKRILSRQWARRRPVRQVGTG